MHFPVWINGVPDGRLDPADRGLAYGDGLFETLLVVARRPVLLEAHLDRLRESAGVLGIPLDLLRLRRELEEFVAACPPDCVVKVILTRGVSGRGYLPNPAASPTRVLAASLAPDWPESHARSGIRVVPCSLRLAAQPLLAGHKHLNRLEQVLLRREVATLGADEGLVQDADGNVIEGVFSNVFVVKDGHLVTPVLAAAGVRGVMRGSIIREALADGTPVSEQALRLEDVLSADEIFFCNSVYGVWPVRECAGRVWAPGVVTRHWQAFWQRQRG